MKRKLLLALFCGFTSAAFMMFCGSTELAAQAPGDKNKKGPFQNPFLKKGRTEPKQDVNAGEGEDKTLPQDELAFFEKKIRPILADKCYSCHTSETAKGPKGELVINTKAGIREGGSNGPSVVPKDLKNSFILNAMRGKGTAQMPPKEKLSDEVIADFEKWISMGAPDPRTGKGSTKAMPIDIEKGKQHWAFQPVKKATPPSDAKNPIDAYVAASLKDKKLTPNGEADKRILLRRVYFDLIGLPPTPAQVDEFLEDKSPNAFEKLVDKLLASPQFGEKWGRHWLDVARYAESSGKEQNLLYPFAWRYRDYVIEAFNADKPYDQFLKEQLAGDLMTPKDDTDKAKKIIATGFLAIGAKSHNERNSRQFALDVADEQIDTFSQSMLGLTIACARCHDHKFDPIPTKDYYSVAGIFMSTETKFGTARGLQNNQATSLVELPSRAEVPVGTTLSKTEQERLKTRVADLKKERDEAIEKARTEKDPNMQAILRRLIQNTQIATMEKQVSYYDSEGNAKKLAMGVSDRFGRDVPVLERGELDKPGEIAPRGFVQVISTSQPRISRGTSGRKELADWVASTNNPLTARVFVNRVWQHLFGQGIVTTPDNFGTTGRPPSHPELLDYLAQSFTDNGWSMKKLIRSVVLSETYRRSSEYSEANAATDPDNVYLWRMSKRRLDAESIRDAMYAVSGELDTKPAVGSVVQKHEGNAQSIQRGFGGPGGGGFGGFNRERTSPLDTSKRAVYIPIIREGVPEVLELFDFSEPSLVSGSRSDTSVPSQGLYMLNNPEVMKLAMKSADTLNSKYSSESQRIQTAFKQTLGRQPTAKEEKAAKEFLDRFVRTETRSFRRKGDAEKTAWAALVQALFATAEFRYLD